MRGKKGFLSTILSASGLYGVLEQFPTSRLVIFNYHRISESTQESLFDTSLLGPNPELFRRQIKWLKSHSDVLSESDLLGLIQSHSRLLPRRPTLITFDDGYRDNYSSAFRILKEEKVPALFFVPTQTVDNRTPSWWDVISYAIKVTRKSEITLSGKRFILPEQKEAAIALSLSMMKSRPHFEMTSFLDDLLNLTGVEPPPESLTESQIMNWDQLIEISQSSLVSIGAHSHSHHVLSTLSLDEQKKELMLSKRILEEKLKTHIRSFAYPVGGYEHFHSETKDLAKVCGFEMAFSFCTGSSLLSAIDPYDIKRIAAPHDVTTMRGCLEMPLLFSSRSCQLRGPKPYHASAHAK